MLMYLSVRKHHCVHVGFTPSATARRATFGPHVADLGESKC